ncbi:putative membrane protein [Wickerhamomyces ciferrii]|uniref:Membrane protein n=1 Tax=Wickerhamomyces ciferrii (strain ATCC 14091 / BCRC 22168 / CBS 111 / JCM 3599 / NBRC 0793 / NRRL Y-1031 F-60-10) TaxID=1206466 RepID=K0KBD4_WICCF|nr:uncharacterized protein BN7_1864 [Wickerhamomyces ciferrii]CCH42320.1 putative membrane protein [Wickerhamomyces ciferrii]
MHPIKLLKTIIPLLPLTLANKVSVDESYTQACSGMYDQSSWGGKTSPFISFELSQFPKDQDKQLSVIIFEYQDIVTLGAPLDDSGYHKEYICDSNAIKDGLCEKAGTFIQNSQKNQSQILQFQVSEIGEFPERYPVKKTGYYCVATYSQQSHPSYKGSINFQNSFGKISASEFPKLSLYAILTICYAVSMAYYGFHFWKHKHELLPLQKYFLAFFLYLTLETLFTWGYYDLINRKGESDVGVKIYMVFTAILSGLKVSFSFFLLLVISLGYGIVYPKLDKKLMFKCQIFTGIHLTFVVIYVLANYLTSPESQSLLAGIPVLPVAISTAIFYAMILKSLSATTALLHQQRQMIKLKMYKHLFRIIFFSLLILLLGIIISSFIFIGMSTTELIEQHWKSRFFFLDFWPSLVYFIIFNLIAFIWRPTDTSYMLAASQQLSTDPENVGDFELDDIQSLNNVGDEAEGYQHLDDNDSLNLGSDDEEGGKDGKDHGKNTKNDGLGSSRD